MDIQEARQLKAAAVEEGRGASPDLLKILDKTDKRITAYVRETLDNPDAHNLWDVVAVVRFLRLLGRYKWRADKVRHYFTYYEHLKFPSASGRKRYKLTPVQCFQFASILGFEREDGRRLVREAILFVPRKFSKTTSTASLAAYELLFGDANAQAYTGANNYTQAQICFKEIHALVRQFDPDRTLFRQNRENIAWEVPNRFGKESFAECLTGNSSTKDGLNASLVIFDEYAAASYVKDRSEGAELLNVLRSSMGARENPLVVIITTASRVPNGPFSFELAAAKSVLADEVEDDSLFAHLFEPDAWDYDNLGREEVWRKCNPHIGVTVQEDYYAEAWKGAQRDAEKMTEFKTKLLNVFVNGSAKAWFEARQLDALVGGFDIECLKGGRPPAMVAIDLSVSDDFSVVTYSIYNKADRRFYIQTDYYIPAATLQEHPNRLLYEKWVADGWMKVCEGAVIDQAMIRDDILRRNAQLTILQIGYDSYKSTELINSLRAAIGKKADKVLTAVSQTYGSFNSGVETFEFAAKSDPPSIVLHANPIQTYCLANAAIDEDKMRNKKPIKRKSNQKIDSAVTTCMTFIMWNNYTF